MSAPPFDTSSIMERRYRRMPRLMFWFRRLRGINYEREMQLLHILCERDKLSVDVGAKIGMYTFRMLRHSREVVVFEPIPVLASMIGHVFRKRACRVEPVALSDRPGSAVMRVPYGKSGEVKFGRSTIEPTNSLTHDDVVRVEEITVELKTLDQCELRGVGFIKIDVEGHELAVLRGAAATIERERPTLLVEANDRHRPGAVAELRELMTGHGYLGFYLADKRLVSLATTADPDHFVREGHENFIFVHESRPDTRERLAKRFRRS